MQTDRPGMAPGCLDTPVRGSIQKRAHKQQVRVPAGLKHLVAVLLALMLGAAQTACACVSAASSNATAHAGHVSIESHAALEHHHDHTGHADMVIGVSAPEHGGCGHDANACEAGHASPAISPALLSAQSAAPSTINLDMKAAVWSPPLTFAHGPVRRTTMSARPPPASTPVSLKVRFLN